MKTKKLSSKKDPKISKQSKKIKKAKEIKQSKKGEFVFSEENFVNPNLPKGLKVLDIKLVKATEKSLKGFGKLFSSQDELTVDKKNFEIKQWP